jgi:biopolymer transport protein ExbD
MAIKRTSDVKAEFSMSSLTDIIFLLLIFFMLTSTFVAPNAIKLLLPKATGQTLSTQTVSVSVTADRKHYVNNQEVAFSEIQTRLRSILSGDEKETIVIRSDQDLDVGHFVRVLSECKKIGSRVIVATTPE